MLTGRDGKLLVDPGVAVSQNGIKNALAAINGDGVKHLINTHWHTDHTDGNEWLHAVGAEITAHENTRKRLSLTTRVEGWNWTFPASPAGALPANVFSSEHEIRHNDTRIALKYYWPAHTDSNIRVHFTEADVVHVGDIWWNGIHPFIDYSTGGSIDGQIRAAELTLATFTGQTIFIPGHGPVSGRAEFADFRDMLVTIRENVAVLKNAGQIPKRSDCGQPNCRLRCQIRAVLNHTGAVYRPCLGRV